MAYDYEKLIFKSVVGYEGLYEISNTGIVKSVNKITNDGRLIKERILKGAICRNGYKLQCLRKNGVNFNALIHRLVAEAFIPNSENKGDVNHIDGNKLNNNVDNLEWCTRSENLKHAIDIGLVKNQCKIRRKVIIKNNDIEIVLDSVKSFATYFKITKSQSWNLISKFGYNFRYKDYDILISENRGDG